MRRAEPRNTPAGGRPELELSDRRDAAIRYMEHGFPHWRIRWHCHDEYELHLIVATRGKMFVGDYVGGFEPGSLVLTGPRLPHNWVSLDTPDRRVPVRDRIVHFDHEALTGAAALLPELRALLPMLERANHGIEFSGQAAAAERLLLAIKHSAGAARFGQFCELMDRLLCCPRQRLLSSAPIVLPADEAIQQKIDRVVNHVLEHYQRRLTLAQAAALVGMNEDYFSRFFRKATGNRFSDFVNRLRVSKACDLLSRTDRQITSICHDVGFNNVANFNRRFYQYKQITPSAYRKQTRQRYSRYDARDRTTGTGADPPVSC